MTDAGPGLGGEHVRVRPCQVPIPKSVRCRSVVSLCVMLLFAILLATPASAIFKGDDANLKDFPWSVTLTWKGRENCGGALIATGAVITAAHCVTLNLRADTQVVFNYRTRAAVSVGIKRIAENHFNHAKHLNDIAIVFIDRRPPSATPIDLVSTDPPLDGQLTAVGFGCSSAPFIEGRCTRWPSRLKGIVLQRKGADCGPLAATEFCVAGGSASLNHGDSGGPVMIKSASAWRLAGVSAALIGEGGKVRAPYRAAVTSIAAERTWIDSVLAGPPVVVRASAVSAGLFQSCALMQSEHVECWGGNGYGQLGDGTTRGHPTPVAVHGIGNALALSAGDYDTCAVVADGGAECWGSNANGQLGDGRAASSRTPVAVTGITDARAIAAAYIHTCAALRSGAAVCWGWYGPGELGEGTNASGYTRTPVRVSGLRGATNIAAAAGHSCAALSDGSVECWGADYDGQLGDGRSGVGQYSATPVRVRGITNARMVAASDRNSCAALADGTVACWGNNVSGALGDGTTSSSSTPVTVAGITDAVAVDANLDYACAVLRSGRVKCWGDNSSGRLGDGTTNDSSMPVTVAGIANARAIATGVLHACAALTSGAVKCWGDNSDGALGDGSTRSSTTPVAVAGIG